MIIIACDPGVTGALAAISSIRGLLDVADLPTCPSGQETGRARRWIDAAALAEVLADWSRRFEFAQESVSAVIERPIAMPTLPAQTIGSQFDTFGVIRALLTVRRWPVTYVDPSVWKRLYGFGRDKDGARETCSQLYPTAPVSRVKDHNRAEAILIAHWHMRQLDTPSQENRALEWAQAA